MNSQIENNNHHEKENAMEKEEIQQQLIQEGRLGCSGSCSQGTVREENGVKWTAC
jgi:hypothetical protein